MNRSALGVCCIALLYCSALPGQSGDTESGVAECSPFQTLGPDGRSRAPDPCDPFHPERSSAGVISARRLTHKPSKTALKEFELATKAWDKSQNDDAIRHLSEATRLDPGYIEAQVKLGAVYADRAVNRSGLWCCSTVL
jgi:hypothetical protein